MDANLINKRACKLLRHSKIFSPPLSPTLAKPHNEVSPVTNFSKLKFNHRFKSAFWKIRVHANFHDKLIIDLGDHLINKRARQLLQCFELFWPRLSPNLAKLHDGVSLLYNFLKLKFDHRFTCPFYKQESTLNFTMFWAIFIPFKPNLSKTA